MKPRRSAVACCADMGETRQRTIPRTTSVKQRVSMDSSKRRKEIVLPTQNRHRMATALLFISSSAKLISRRSRLFSQEANPVEHFLKTGLGAQRVEFFVNREPENQIRIPHSVSLLQCFKRFFPHSQVHIDRKSTRLNSSHLGIS